MKIKIYNVQTKRDLRKFIHLPAKIHKNHPNWVPPIYLHEWSFFNPKKNKSFNYCDTILLLASQNGKVVGRVMGIINHKYNQTRKENSARFCFLETYNNFDIAEALLSNLEEWAKAMGTVKIIGPLGFSNLDPQGLMIEGFDQPNIISSNYNFPFLVGFVEKAGYSKESDLVAYLVNTPDVIPDFYTRIYERAIRNNSELKVINFATRKQIKPYVKPILNLVNESFNDIQGFTPFEEQQMNELASRYLPILDPRFLTVVINDNNEVIAFIIGMPDISDEMKRSRGFFLPFCLTQIFVSLKRTKQLNLLLGAIKENYRNKGVDSIMGVKILKEAQKAGLKYIDSHLEWENNLKVRAEMEKMGGKVYKRYRIYQKQLN